MNQLFSLLVSAIVPRDVMPVNFLDRKGSANIVPISIGFAFVGLGMLSASDEPERWVAACKIGTASVMERDAASIAPGTIVRKHDKWIWSPQIDGVDGVLIIHPPAPDIPATIEMGLEGRLSDQSKVIRIKTRGSQHEPGVSMKVISSGKIIREIALNRFWETVEFPVSDIPVDAKSVTFSFSPVGWEFEYCYVDKIEIGTPSRISDQVHKQPINAIIKEPAIGVWAWGGGPQQFKLEPNGDVIQPGRKGRWTCSNPTGNPRKYVIHWEKEKPIDSFTLSADGTTMEGGNQFGVKLRATRVGVPSATASMETPPAGKPGGGIVLKQLSMLSQSSGGKSRNMADFQNVLKDYGIPEDDTKPHPEALIYKGQAPYEGGPEVSIPYLMPLEKAAAILMKRPGISSPQPAVAPGFPPGMLLREYDIRFGRFNRLCLVTDQIGQMVAIQFVCENGDDPRYPAFDWKDATLPMRSTTDFVEPETGSASAKVWDRRFQDKFIAIDLQSRGETVLFLPEPIIRLSLFHMAQDLRKRGRK